MKSMLRAAALLVLSTGVLAGPAALCTDQVDCFKLTFTESKTNASTACTTGNCQFKVCLTLNTAAPCTKNGDTLSHTCKKTGENTVCRSEVNKNFTGITANQTIGTGFSQCQTGLPGSTLYFLLKDGSGCSLSPTTSYTMATKPTLGLISGSSATCQPRPASIGSCTGNSPGDECVWSVTLPACTGTSSDLTLTTQEDTTSCDAQQQALQTMNKFTSGLGPSCPIDSAQKVLADCCNCTRPSASCPYLVCQKYVPPTKIAELQGLVTSGTCP